VGFAAPTELTDRLRGKRVGLIFCGGQHRSVDAARILEREI